MLHQKTVKVAIQGNRLPLFPQKTIPIALPLLWTVEKEIAFYTNTSALIAAIWMRLLPMHLNYMMPAILQSWTVEMEE